MDGDTREKIFVFVRDRIIEGDPPSVRDVQRAFHFKSVGTAREHIEKLIEEGRLIKKSGLARGLRLPPSAKTDKVDLKVQIIGTVRAGHPELAFEDPMGHITVTTRLALNEIFALRVKGDSMTDVGIMHNDIVIVRKQAEANSGQIVVACLGDEECTVKTYRNRNGREELHPQSPHYPILIPKDNQKLTILGIVFEVRRHIPAKVEYFS
jgi:repressor LexA